MLTLAPQLTDSKTLMYAATCGYEKFGNDGCVQPVPCVGGVTWTCATVYRALSCPLLTEVTVVSCVARTHENNLRHVVRHAMDDLRAMRLWNRRPTARKPRARVPVYLSTQRALGSATVSMQ
jgi:hypothetical protein